VAGVRVPVIEKATGRILTGEEAPLSSELADWLLQHPGYVLIHAFVGGSLGIDTRNKHFLKVNDFCLACDRQLFNIL